MRRKISPPTRQGRRRTSQTGRFDLLLEKLPSEADLAFAMPQPTALGIADLQALYARKFSRELTEGEAREILCHLITIVFNTALINIE